MQTSQKKPVSGELLLLAGLTLNSLAIELLVLADFGLSVVSSVSYVVSLIVPGLSVGVANMLEQTLWIVALCFLLRRVKPGYVIAFGLGVAFGYLLDLWGLALVGLPTGLAFRVLYFVLAFCLMSVGISCLLLCRLPVLPFDTVPREFVLEKGWSVRKARTVFDLLHLGASLLLIALFLRRMQGVGVGTVVQALCMGFSTGKITDFARKRFDVRLRFKWEEKLS